MNLLETAMEHRGSPVLLFSAATFSARYRELQTALPQAKHHYALKALPYEGCIRALEQCDGYIDVAGEGEISLVNKVAPALLERCIYTHPIKTEENIRFALDHGIRVMVADNQYELEKLLPFASELRLLIRIAFPNPEARCDLSAKFGATLTETRRLIRFCKENKLSLLGCSFHVGSQMLNPNAHLHAIRATRALYDWYEQEYNECFDVLNIGGGFPARLEESIPDLGTFCRPIRECLDCLFPETEIWTEPGRCLAADSMAAISEVIGKSFRQRKYWYYLNDGVYNTFSGKIYDHAEYRHQPLTPRSTGELFESVLAGPTCDSIDILKENTLLPEMQIGDFFITRQAGAYGWASRTDFNHLSHSRIVEVDYQLHAKTSECSLAATGALTSYFTPVYS